MAIEVNKIRELEPIDAESMNGAELLAIEDNEGLLKKVRVDELVTDYENPFFVFARDVAPYLVPTHSLTPRSFAGDGLNFNVALVPRGNGAILAQVPTGNIDGGNARGNNALDLQMLRASSDQVASGFAGVILSGTNNANKGTMSAVLSGFNNNIAAFDTFNIIIGGSNNKISGNSHTTFLGGGGDNIINDAGGYTVITGGSNNNIEGYSYASSIVGGAQNKIDGDLDVISGGYNNIIENDSAGNGNAISGGGHNEIISTGFSNIAGGTYNTLLSASSFSAISGGSQNKITSSMYSTIVGGGSGVITKNTFSSIVGGSTNEITSTTGKNYNFIGSGSLNKITESGSSVIVGGFSHNIQNNAISVAIGGGSSNTINGGSHHGIASGNSNSIIGNAGGFIGAGNNNLLDFTTAPTGFSGILSGTDNKIYTGHSSIAGGSNNVINNSGGPSFSFIGAGNNNEISNMFSFIGSGSGNSITDTLSVGASSNSILCGSGNVVDSALASSILGGNNNTITGGEGTFILGNDSNATGIFSIVTGKAGNDKGLNYSQTVADGSSKRQRQNVFNSGSIAISTTPVVLTSFPMPISSSYYFKGEIVLRNSAGNTSSIDVQVSVIRDGAGVATIQHTNTPFHTDGVSTNWLIDYNFTAGVLQVRCTSTVAATVLWATDLKIIQLES